MNRPREFAEFRSHQTIDTTDKTLSHDRFLSIVSMNPEDLKSASFRKGTVRIVSSFGNFRTLAVPRGSTAPVSESIYEFPEINTPQHHDKNDKTPCSAEFGSYWS